MTSFRNNQKFQTAFLKSTFSTITFPWSWSYDWLNWHFVCYSILYDMHCLSYFPLIQFHLSGLHTSSAHQVIAGHGQLSYLTISHTSGRFVNYLWDKSVLIGRETVKQLASEINNFSMTKICITQCICRQIQFTLQAFRIEEVSDFYCYIDSTTAVWQ